MESAGLESVLAEAFVSRHPEEAGRRLERMASPEGAALLERVEEGAAAAVLERMAPLETAACLQAMSAARAGPALGHMELDAAAAALRRVGDAVREALLDAAPTATSDHLRRLLAYPPATAGALMEPRVWSAAEDQEVGDIVAAARREKPELATYLYGVDREGRLVGVATLADLMRADPKALLETVLRSDVERVPATASQRALAANAALREHRVLPVVDEAGRLLGAVRQRAVRAVEEEPAPGTRLPASAFGELYWIGITGMLSGLLAAFSGPATRRSENEP